jgi:hypothetical protein
MMIEGIRFLIFRILKKTRQTRQTTRKTAKNKDEVKNWVQNEEGRTTH